MLSLMVAVFGRLERLSSFKHVRPFLNSTVQNFTVNPAKIPGTAGCNTVDGGINYDAEFLYTRVQFVVDLCRRMFFQKQIFNSQMFDLFHFPKNTPINLLKRLSNNNCAFEITEVSMSTFQRMRKHIPPFADEC